MASVTEFMKSLKSALTTNDDFSLLEMLSRFEIDFCSFTPEGKENAAGRRVLRA